MLFRSDLKEDSNKQLATVTVNYKLEAQESTLQTVYQVRPNGAVKVRMHFVPGNKSLPEMPRLGMRMILPAEYDVMTWLLSLIHIYAIPVSNLN